MKTYLKSILIEFFNYKYLKEEAEKAGLPIQDFLNNLIEEKRNGKPWRKRTYRGNISDQIHNEYDNYLNRRKKILDDYIFKNKYKKNEIIENNGKLYKYVEHSYLSQVFSINSFPEMICLHLIKLKNDLSEYKKNKEEQIYIDIDEFLKHGFKKRI